MNRKEGKMKSKVRAEIEKWRERGANVVVPFEITSDRVDPFHAFRVAVVYVDPDPAHGEVWPVGKREVGGRWVQMYALAKSALQKIGVAAGIIWDPRHTRRLDDHSDPDYVEFQAVGLYRGPDGQWRVIQGTKELDLRVIEEEVRDEQWTKLQDPNFKLPPKYSYMEGKPKEEILEFLVRREMLQWRKHKVARAETGAMLRALRSIGIKSAYTEEELGKPFVFVRVDYAPDWEREDVKKIAEKAHRAAIRELYGPPEGITPEEEKEEDEALRITRKGETPQEELPF